MNHQSAFSFSLLILSLQFTQGLTQSPVAAPVQAPSAPVTLPPPAAPPTQVPATSGPTNVTKILVKGGHFNVFIRLLKATQEDGHLFSELNDTNNGITIFAPSDAAFSSLKTGTLNMLSDQDKTEFVKFHIVPTFLSTSQFQTVSNPIATKAGAGSRESINVTAYPNSVNITTGLTNASISDTVYTDNQLAIYRVDKVLLPMDVFAPNSTAPAPAPAGEKPKKKAPAVQAPAAVVPVDTSSAENHMHSHVALFFGAGAATAILALVLGW